MSGNMINKISGFLFKTPIPVAIFLWLPISVTKKVAISYPVDILNPDVPYKSFSNPDSRNISVRVSFLIKLQTWSLMRMCLPIIFEIYLRRSLILVKFWNFSINFLTYIFNKYLSRFREHLFSRAPVVLIS